MMGHDALATVYDVLSERWPLFKFRKSKKTWGRETNDKILLLIQCQRSQWGETYYLNFGVYYLEIQMIAKQISNPPQQIDWHLYARYESFKALTTDEQNILFSFEDADRSALTRRCDEVASFCTRIILPRLETLGDIASLNQNIEKQGNDAFDPFNTQKIARADIIAYVREAASKRPQSA